MYSSDTVSSEIPTIANALQLALLAVVVVILAEFALAVIFSYISAGRAQPETALVAPAVVNQGRVLTMERDDAAPVAVPPVETPESSEVDEPSPQHLEFARWLVQHRKLEG